MNVKACVAVVKTIDLIATIESTPALAAPTFVYEYLLRGGLQLRSLAGTGP